MPSTATSVYEHYSHISTTATLRCFDPAVFRASLEGASRGARESLFVRWISHYLRKERFEMPVLSGAS